MGGAMGQPSGVEQLSSGALDNGAFWAHRCANVAQLGWLMAIP